MHLQYFYCVTHIRLSSSQLLLGHILPVYIQINASKAALRGRDIICCGDDETTSITFNITPYPVPTILL